MNKIEAIKKLELLEKEQKELRRIIEQPKELIDRINTIELVYKELGQKQPKLNDFNFLPEKRRVKALNFEYIQAIEELFNEGWKPNWRNSNEYKYFPYFQFGSGGFCFRRSDGCSSGCFGVPGFYKTEKISIYVGKTFLPIYQAYLPN